jgi:hypothetical protein
MQQLRNKTILLISPQSWGKMLVSKHHYAVELAKRGNRVYFLNPPDQKAAAGGGVTGRGGGTGLDERIRIEPSGVQDNLLLISHRLSFPYNIKFHFIGLFHLLMKRHVAGILRRIGRPVDIVWSFDLGDLYPFSFFPARSLKIFHPVDEPLNGTAIRSAKGAKVIFSVTKEILEKYKEFSVPRHFINHGLIEEFLGENGADGSDKTGGKPLKVGFAGNLLRADIDRGILLQIIRDNPEVDFEAWGAYRSADSNIGAGDDAEMHAFIADLLRMPNLVLQGPVSSSALASGFRKMDAFLICYDVKKDQSKGTNYHKVMEYLSTGKVIISNNITTYSHEPDLVQMIGERDRNDGLPALFKKIISDIGKFNAPSLSQKRRAFALSNTYQKQVDRIEALL